MVVMAVGVVVGVWVVVMVMVMVVLQRHGGAPGPHRLRPLPLPDPPCREDCLQRGSEQPAHPSSLPPSALCSYPLLKRIRLLRHGNRGGGGSGIRGEERENEREGEERERERDREEERQRERIGACVGASVGEGSGGELGSRGGRGQEGTCADHPRRANLNGEDHPDETRCEEADAEGARAHDAQLRDCVLPVDLPCGFRGDMATQGKGSSDQRVRPQSETFAMGKPGRPGREAGRTLRDAADDLPRQDQGRGGAEHPLGRPPTHEDLHKGAKRAPEQIFCQLICGEGAGEGIKGACEGYRSLHGPAGQVAVRGPGRLPGNKRGAAPPGGSGDREPQRHSPRPLSE